MKWMGIDPGETTGVAWWTDDKKVRKGWPVVEGVQVSPLDGWEQVDAWLLFHDWRGESLGGKDPHLRLAAERLCVLVEKHEPDILVIEDFILRPNAKSAARAALSPVRIIAMLDVWLWDVVEFSGDVRYQQPSQAKGVITDKRLRSRGWWIPGKQHSRDAARHIALAYMREHGI